MKVYDPRVPGDPAPVKPKPDIESQARMDALQERFKAADYHWGGGLQDLPPDRFGWSQFSRNERALLAALALNAILIVINVALMWLT